MRAALLALALAAPTVALACGTTPHEPTSAPAACVDTRPEPDATEAQIADIWAARGDYPIVMTLEPGGKATREDQISTCPPGAQCFWAGVVFNRGTWTLDGDVVRLDWPSPDTTAGASPPSQLRVVRDCESGALRLVERGTLIYVSGSGR